MFGPAKGYACAQKFHAGNAPLSRCNQRVCPCEPFGERVRSERLSNLNSNRRAQPLDSRVTRLVACKGVKLPPIGGEQFRTNDQRDQSLEAARQARLNRSKPMCSRQTFISATDPCVFADALYTAWLFYTQPGNGRVQSLLSRGYRYSLALSARARLVTKDGKRAGGCGGPSVVVESPQTDFIYSYGGIAQSEILAALPGACRAISSAQQASLQASIAEFWLGAECAAIELAKIKPADAAEVPLDTAYEKQCLQQSGTCLLAQTDNQAVVFTCE